MTDKKIGWVSREDPDTGGMSRIVEGSVIAIWDDLSMERSGYYRAFEVASPEATVGCPVIGYCSPGGSHRTIRATVAEVRRLYPSVPVYRNGRKLAG